MSEAKVLVIDDKANYLSLIEKVLGKLQVSTAKDGKEGLALLASQSFDVVVSDIKMPGIDGLTVLQEARNIDPNIEVILMTAYGSVDKAVEAMKLGAFHYLTKPFEPDELLLLVNRAVERRGLKAKAREFDRLQEEAAPINGLISKSPAMRQVLSLIRKVAPMNLTVLLEGESGTGKELLARAIHQESTRKRSPFVALNCGALPENLLESELFGHKRGAFTGANEDRVGLFESANEGTLFLDEIGEMPLNLQVKLNRVLQESEIRRLGESRNRKVDVRIIAATLRDLRAQVDAGQFREDLFYRLNVFRIRAPSLRDPERREDIGPLIEHFLQKHAKLLRLRIPTFSATAMRLMLNYPWPGNVRELEHSIERALVVAENGEITPEALPSELNGVQWSSTVSFDLSSMTYKQAIEVARDKMSQDYLRQLFTRHQGNVSAAATDADIERESLYRLARRYGIDPAQFRNRGE